MRCLRRTTTAALLGLALSATPAYAGDLAAAVRVANAVYPGVPQRCGTVNIEHGRLDPENEANHAIAEAREDECLVILRPGIADSYSDPQLCSLLTHEWGHLAGRRFPENPSDPHHSPSPADHMYGPWLVHHPACGESHDARAARQTREANARLAERNAAERRETRQVAIMDRLEELKDRLRAAKAAMRHVHGARRVRYEKRIKRLRARIRSLRAEYRSLASRPLL